MIVNKTVLHKSLHITKNMINQRIDNFLIKKFSTVPKSMIYRILRTGKIRINKKRIKPCYKLKVGDNIKIPFIKIQNDYEKKIFIPKKITDLLIKNILYEDNDLLVLNKPSGIAVHGGSGLSFGIIEIFRKLFPLNKNIELVHRLDKDTSGVLLLSKKSSILRSLHEQLRQKSVQKNYIALVHGHWPQEIKKINLPLLKNSNRTVSVNVTGKKSETYFKIKHIFNSVTLMNIKPITGRTHQIRVHTCTIGHPIIFDNRYGNAILDKKFHYDGKNNLLLHANKITFIHPKNKKKIFINAPLNNNFKNCLDQLK